MTKAGPDRGYSWVIMLSCAYVHFALFGVFRSWGIIYVAVLREYDVTREEASWPFSLCAAVFQLIGPVVSIITHFISRRQTCIMGSLVATLGVVFCYFAPSALWITIFYGVVHGLGFGIIITLIPYYLNSYFVKHRATAMGIAFSGGAVGSLVVPIIMEWLLDNYNLSGSFLLLGGIVMNNLIATALLRPPSWLKRTKDRPQVLNETLHKDLALASAGETRVLEKEPMLHSPAESGFQDLDNNCNSHDNELPSLQESSQLNTYSTEETSDVQDTLLSNCDSVLFDGQQSQKAYIVTSIKDSQIIPKADKLVKEPLMQGVAELVQKPTNLQRAVFAVLEILKQPKFYLISFTMFIYFLCLQCFFVVIIDYANDKGIEEDDAKYVLAIFSLTDIVGRSGLGWITDRNFVKRNNMVIFNLIAIGVSMQLYPLIDHLTYLLVLAAFHGIPVGSAISLFFVLQAEYLGMKRLTLAVGLTGFINGVFTLFRPAIIGLFRDTIGSYDWMFHVLGMLCYALAIIWLAEAQAARARDKKSAMQESLEKA